MSYRDPHGSAEPRGWPPPDDPPAWQWHDSSDETRLRARHAGAAPEAYADNPHHDSGERYRDDVPAGRDNGYADPGSHSFWPEQDESSRRHADDGTSTYPRNEDGRDDTGLTEVIEPVDAPLLEPVAPGTGPEFAPADEGTPPRSHSGRRRASRTRPATTPPRTGRAGRNLPAAIGVGLGLGVLIVVPLFLYRPAFLAVIAIAISVGTWEMIRAIRRSGANPPMVPLLAGGVLMIGLAWWAGPDALSLGLLVTVLSAMVWRLSDGPAGFQRDLTASALIAVYVPFLGGFAAMLAAPSDGALRIMVTLVAVVLSDTGGYVAGVFLGRHPMAPSISPKKSWEGFGGSVGAAALGSALLLWLLLDVAPWWGAVFGLAVSGAAVLGDLAESMIKRDLGIKDMSNLLPGHGGLMDRLDSILFAVPTAYLLLAIFAPTG